MTLVAGTRLGPYEIEGLLGVGGMGEVYRATDPRLGRKVAVKVLPSEVASDSARLSLFEREARAVAALNHPNILTVHDVGTHDDTPYVVTELLEGETLRELVSRRKPTVPQVLTHMLQAARGLEAAHAKGIVHRDLKPENLFLTTDGRVKVLDFGLAKLVRSEAEITSEVSTAAHSTPPGQVAGTVLYMSPEQARAQVVDVRSDVFSFGVVLYELLAGQHPFRKETLAGTLTSIVEETPAGLESLGRSIPPAVAGIVRRCLQKEREDRYASGHDVAMVLEAILVAPSGAAVLQEVEERSPYPGLSSFTEKDAAAFFGREREIEELWRRVPNRGLLAVIGPSGAGKTSFVRAGVLPARPEGWGAVVSTPGTAPTRHLAQALARELSGDPDAVQRLLRFDEPDTVVETVSRWRQNHGEALLVVDQFEELLTLNPPEVQESFAALLGRLAADADVHVLLSLRDDFLIRCCELGPLTPVLQELTALLALSQQDLRRAIEEPAKKQGYRFEDEALVAEMVEAVEGARAALPLLAFAVSCLWERRDRDRRVLTRAAYEDIGGIAGALAQHAEATMDRIGPERQNVVREVFRNLVTAQGTRAVTARDELLSALPDRESAEAVLGHLIDARLLTSYEVDGDEGQASHHRIEVVHESLLKAWPRLVRWQTQDEDGAQLRDQLKQAAHLWDDKGRSPDLLWSGSALQEYEVWRMRYPGQLTALEDGFAKAMVERSQRRRRLRRAMVGGAFVVLAGIAAAVTISRHQVATSRDEARAEARRAESAKLLALAQARLEDDPTEALALATAALEMADTKEARVFVMEALWEAPPALELPGERTDPRAPRFSSDGAWLAAAGHTTEAAVWGEDGTGPMRLGGLEPDPRCSNVARWSDTGFLVTGLGCGYGSRVHVWELPAGQRVRTIDFDAPSDWAVGERHLLVQTPQARGQSTGKLLLRSWLLPGGQAEALGEVDPRALGVTEEATLPPQHGFEPRGRGWIYARGRDVYLRPLPVVEDVSDQRVVRHPATAVVKPVERVNDTISFSRDRSGEIRQWSLAGGEPVPGRVIPRPATAPVAVLPVPGGRWLWGTNESLVWMWDLEGLPGARPLTLRRSGSWYGSGISAHPDGVWLVVSTHGPEDLTFWPLTRAFPSVVEGYTSGFTRPVAFSPDGRWLATAWPMDGGPGEMALRLWPVPGGGESAVKRLDVPQPTLWTNLVFDPQGRYLFAVGNGDHAWIVPLDGSPARRLPVFSDSLLLQAAAVSPEGRLVATAAWYGKGEKTLRVWDVESESLRVFDLPPSAMPAANADGSPAAETGFERGVHSMQFSDEATLYTAGDGGLRRWNLETGVWETVLEPEPGSPMMKMAAEPRARRALVRTLEAPESATLLVDLATGTSRSVPEVGHENRMILAGSGSVVALGGADGIVRVGRLDGGPLHLFVGHDGPATHIAVSPDLEWVASAGEDHTLRLWPMPDLAAPPLHALPHDELIAKLRSLTNLRAVRDAESSTGWSIDLDPFPGWKEVPEW